MRTNVAPFLSTFIILASCARTSSPSLVTSKDLPVPEKITPTIESIQRNFVDKKCLSCHTQATESNRFIVLRDISQLIEGNTSGSGRKNLIKPGCPKESFFLSIMREGKMPPPAYGGVGEESIKTIEEWIAGLNPNYELCSKDEPPD